MPVDDVRPGDAAAAPIRLDEPAARAGGLSGDGRPRGELLRITRLAAQLLDAPAQVCAVTATGVQVLAATPRDLQPPPLRVAQQLATAEGCEAVTDRRGTAWFGAPAGTRGRSRFVLCAPTRADGGATRAALGDLAALARVALEHDDAVAEVAVMRQLLAATSHDLRNPLSVLQAGLETLLGHRDELTPAQTSRIADLAVRQAHRMATMIDGLLAADGIDQGEAFVDVDLVLLVRDAVEGGRLVHRLVDLRLKHELPTDSVVVPGTPDALARLVSNLVTNAAIHGGGHVWLGLRVEDDHAVVEIDDDGPGLPDDSPLDGGDRRVGAGGHGLGLLIARRIVGMHNGSIDHVDRPGGGTCITVRLPLRSPGTIVL